MISLLKKQTLQYWTLIVPLLAFLFYFSGLGKETHFFFTPLLTFLLILSVMAAVYHSEVIAEKLGEPLGTIILAISITIIEVAIIFSLMITGDKNLPTLARDTVYATTMLILNGIIGICLFLGGFRHYEQFFSKHSTNTALISLISIIVLTLILPNYTSSRTGPFYSSTQLYFVAVACLIIYGGFLLAQTTRHKDYFIAKETTDNNPPVSTLKFWTSFLFLPISLTIVVLLAKELSSDIELFIQTMNLPKTLVGVIIAIIVLLPEGISAIKATKKNNLQISLNLALGSALASIGLTIPVLALLANWYGLELSLGIDLKSTILLFLSFAIVMLSLSKGKTNMQYGIVLLVNLIAYLFTIIYP